MRTCLHFQERVSSQCDYCHSYSGCGFHGASRNGWFGRLRDDLVRILGKRKRLLWYAACVDESLESTSPFLVFRNDEHRGYECVILRDRRLLSAILPVQRMDYRGDFEGLFIFGYQVNSWYMGTAFRSLAALYHELEPGTILGKK